MTQADIISFHPGRQHNFEQAVQLHRLFHGFRHVTSLHFTAATVKGVSKYAKKIGGALEKRSSPLPGNIVHAIPNHEIGLLLQRARGKALGPQDFVRRNEQFQRSLLRKFAPPKVCIGYDTSSWVVFEAWKGKSKLVLDLSIAVPQYKKTLAAELGGNTEMLNNLTQGDEHLYGIYEKELDLADVVLCGSQFVKDSCLSLGVSEKKLKVLPYGADLEKFRAAPHWLPKESGKTKIVFVGSVNHRKGADILLKMWPEIAAAFPAAELHFFGGVSIDLPQNLPQVHFHGFVAQKDLVAEMRTAQISVLPTFFEGSSLAIYQSMAMGLAVVTTPNAGSVITPGKNGLLVPYGSEAALKDALVQVLANADYRETLATAARRDIQQYTWDNYGVNLANIITDELAQGLRLKHYPEPVAGSESAGMGVKTVVAK